MSSLRLREELKNKNAQFLNFCVIFVPSSLRRATFFAEHHTWRHVQAVHCNLKSGQHICIWVLGAYAPMCAHCSPVPGIGAVHTSKCEPNSRGCFTMAPGIAGRSLLGDAEFHFPGHKHPLDGDGTCVVTNPRYFNCSAAAPGILRLCPCTATK